MIQRPTAITTAVRTITPTTSQTVSATMPGTSPSATQSTATCASSPRPSARTALPRRARNLRGAPSRRSPRATTSAAATIDGGVVGPHAVDQPHSGREAERGGRERENGFADVLQGGHPRAARRPVGDVIVGVSPQDRGGAGRRASGPPASTLGDLELVAQGVPDVAGLDVVLERLDRRALVEAAEHELTRELPAVRSAQHLVDQLPELVYRTEHSLPPARGLSDPHAPVWWGYRRAEPAVGCGCRPPQ